MLLSARRHILSVVVLAFWLVASGCNSQTANTSQPQQQPVSTVDLPAVSSRLHEIAASGNLSDLHWSNFTDYSMHFQHIYEASNFAPVWLSNGKPTPQALAVIQALEASQQKGLNPDDYDASRWPDRLHSIDGSPTPDTLARFDAALTVGVMRYISDLHIGRVNPKHFSFGIDIEQKKYDLPQFVTTNVIHASNVQSVLDGVEPVYNGYRNTEAMLQFYLRLAAQGDGPPVPDVTKTVAPGDAYPGISQLTQRLRLFGDLHAETVIDTNTTTYSGSLVDGVKTFQSRHGLAVTGKIDKDTVRQLNTPLAFRVKQLQYALERWRWLPPQFPQPPVVANIPEFIVRAYGPNQKVEFSSNVVVGKAMRTQTPIFAKDMRYIVFRPYWNVPTGIVRGEIIPGITRDRHYISKKNFEVTDFNGNVITDGVISDEVLAQLRAGKLTVRQKPGPTNSLGLIKLMFPNEYNVYLHSTPSQQLFSQTRRDFSHGCIRVEKPAELAAWVLRDKPEWSLERVRAAMQTGKDNVQTNLTAPLPVLILYGTAVVDEQNQVHFFDDIYGYDGALEKVLARGYPYPG